MEINKRFLGLSREHKITWHTWERKKISAEKVLTESEIYSVQAEVMGHLADVDAEELLFKGEGMTRRKYTFHRTPKKSPQT